MISNIKYILFDLDGTLVDSLPDLTFCINEMLKSLGFLSCSEDKVYMWIGCGAEVLVEQALSHALGKRPTKDVQEKAFSVYMAICKNNLCVRTQFYPQVKEVLALLKSKKYKLGCVTNKPEGLTQSLLVSMGVDEMFDVIIGGDTTPKKKPDPYPLLYAVKKLGYTAKEGVMVGDSITDVHAARNANIKVIAVSYGYNHGIDIRKENPDKVIDSFGALVKIFE